MNTNTEKPSSELQDLIGSMHMVRMFALLGARDHYITGSKEDFLHYLTEVEHAVLRHAAEQSVKNAAQEFWPDKKDPVVP